MHLTQAAGGRTSKLTSLEDLASHVKPGSTVVIGGALGYGVPMSVLRELIRQQCSDLTLLAFTQGFGAELAMASGLATRLIRNFIDLEHLGLAPHLRNPEMSSRIEEWESIGMIYALAAAASGAPFAALPEGIERTLFGAEGDQLHYRQVVNPFSGKSHLAVEALRPDVALLHVSEADEYGNCRYHGFRLWDELYASASDRVLVTCERLISNDEIRADPTATTIPGYMVERVAVVPGGAYPTAAIGHYDTDWTEVATYVQAAKSPSDCALTTYLDHFANEREIEYLKTRVRWLRRDAQAAGAVVPAHDVPAAEGKVS